MRLLETIKKRAESEDGLGVIEIIVAMALISLIVAVSVPAFTANLGFADQNALRASAVQLANSQLTADRAFIEGSMACSTELHAPEVVDPQGRLLIKATTHTTTCPPASEVVNASGLLTVTIEVYNAKKPTQKLYDLKSKIRFGDGIAAAATNQAPSASFTYASTNLVTNFDATGSTDADGTIARYAWTFGPSGAAQSGATLSKPSYTYPAAGTYPVTLTVTDDKGATSSVTQSITVTAPAAANQSPVAGFTATPADLVVAFDGSASRDPDGSITNYSWNYGNGTSNTNGGATPTYTYPAAGTYNVILTVTDNKGATASSTKAVTVTAPVTPSTPATPYCNGSSTGAECITILTFNCAVGETLSVTAYNLTGTIKYSKQGLNMTVRGDGSKPSNSVLWTLASGDSAYANKATDVVITGNFTGFTTDAGAAETVNGTVTKYRTGCLTGVKQWGARSGMVDLTEAFIRQAKFTSITPTQPPSSVTTMDRMFFNATNFKQNISGWNVTNVTKPVNFATGSGLTSANIPAKFR
jgi:surface protein